MLTIITLIGLALAGYCLYQVGRYCSLYRTMRRMAETERPDLAEEIEEVFYE